MEGFTQFWTAAFWIGLAGLPIAFVGLAFLHAARTPQWVWIMSGRTQIYWLLGLLLGAGIIPLGVPAAVYYFWKLRPDLDALERGDLGRLAGPDDLNEPPTTRQS